MASTRKIGRLHDADPWDRDRESQGRTTVTVPIHPEFAESLRAARAAGIIGAEVFTGKKVRDRVLPMHKKAWAAKFKKYAVLAGVNEPRKAAMGFAKRGPRSRLTLTAPKAR